MEGIRPTRIQYLLLDRNDFHTRQGVKYGEGKENLPHPAYSGRTRQKSFRGRYLKKSPPSGSAVKTFDHSFVLCSADNLCPVFKTLCQPLWGLMLDH